MKKTTIALLLLTAFTGAFAQDWPNLERFQKDNVTIKYMKDKDNRIVFMGNSITEYWRAEFFKDNKSFVNRGISGQTTPQMLLRFRQDVIDLKPSAVVILAGINDIGENTGPSTIKMISDNIISMAELAGSNNIHVILCSVLPANKFPWRKEIKPAPQVLELNNLIKKYANENNITYVDYYSAMVDDNKGLRSDLGNDGVHPNAKGYAIMEDLIMAAFAKLYHKAELPDPLEAGWNGSKVCKVLKEDENQRILKCTFPPNVGHEKHYHAAHFGYTLRGGTFSITDDKGTKEIDVKDGTTWSKKEASVHEVLNVGNSTSIYLIIEPKD